MGKKYSQLSLEDRTLIALLLREGVSVREIGKELLRAPSTISREIRRNFPRLPSSTSMARLAEQRADRRKRTSHKRMRLKSEFTRKFVREKLLQGWSPEQIAGKLQTEFPQHSTNHESIYLFVYNNAPELRRYLPRRRKRRKKRTFTLKHPGHKIPQAISIDFRSPNVALRNEFGHWEADTAYSSKSRSVLLVMTERRSRYVKITKLQRLSALCTRRALIRRLKTLKPHLRKTLTLDNGSENADHLLVSRALGLSTFFCHPYASYEKGTVENTIGLIRRIFPKGTDFDTVTTADLRRVEQLLNSRPRKCLGFKTPSEIFSAGVALAY